MTDTDDSRWTDGVRLRLGRLFHLRLKRNADARRAALDSIRCRPDGRWQARIGGRMRGKTEVFATQRAAEAAVNEHYNSKLAAAVEQCNAEHRRLTGGH